MKLWFFGKYNYNVVGTSDLLINTEHLEKDLYRVGYDEEHVTVIIDSLKKCADEIQEN